MAQQIQTSYSNLKMIDKLVEWGNSLEVIADEGGLPLEAVRAVATERDSTLGGPGMATGLRRAYANLYPLDYLALPSAPLLRHREAIVRVLGGSAALRKRFERYRNKGVVPYSTADELLTAIGLPVELVYGDVAMGAAA